MIKLIAEKLKKEYPHSEGLEDWDNIGIIINLSNQSKKVLITIDLTDEVLEECLSKEIKNVISYHPVIFKGIKNIHESSIPYKCITNGIAVYCPHTSLDKRMNMFLLKSIQEELKVFSDYLYESLVCIGKIDKPVYEILNVVKKILQLEKVRVAQPSNINFIPKNVLVGVGAGFTYTDHTDSLIITGEMRHHEILHAVKNGNFVILVEHSNGERFYLSELKKVCENILSDFDFFISEKDSDPVVIK